MKKVGKRSGWGSTGWDRFYEEKGQSWRDKDYRFLHAVFDLSNLKGSLLDVGCGLGDGLEYLKEHCPMITEFNGTDFSDSAVKRAQEMRPWASFFQCDIHAQLPRFYDNVICLQTLEHLRQPAEAVRNLVAAARETVVVAVPYKNRRPDEDHLWSFSKQDFSKVFTHSRLGQNRTNIYWLLNKVPSTHGFIPVSTRGWMHENVGSLRRRIRGVYKLTRKYLALS